MKTFLKAAILVGILVIVLMAVVTVPMMKESGYANCGIAESENLYTGRLLKNNGNVVLQRLRIEECEQKDKEIDNGDGNEIGKVRWAVCLSGPDCDEAGLF